MKQRLSLVALGIGRHGDKRVHDPEFFRRGLCSDRATSPKTDAAERGVVSTPPGL
jgi:hypothetical protein